jgi:hypothetical protein
MLCLCALAAGGSALAQSAYAQRVPLDAISKRVGVQGSIKETAPIFSQMLPTGVLGISDLHSNVWATRVRSISRSPCLLTRFSG